MVERLHCDQNPITKPGFHCVQGMIPLVDVQRSVGGLQLVPGTHGDATQAMLIREYPELQTNDGDDWLDETGDLVTISPGPGVWYERDFYFVTRGEGVTVKRDFEPWP